MPEVLGISTVLGIAGVFASFGLFYLAELIFHPPAEVIQTFMFLKLAVAGHLTIFITRTRGPFWSIRPAPILLWSAIGTKLLATLAAVYGFLMAPVSWQWALLIWTYAIVWFLVNDRIKLAAYRIFSPAKAKTSSDVTPIVAKRAYELYERQGHREGHAVQDWLEAEREIRKEESPK